MPPAKRSKISALDETESRLEDFLLKMERKKENVRRDTGGAGLERTGELSSTDNCSCAGNTLHFSSIRHSPPDEPKASKNIQKGSKSSSERASNFAAHRQPGGKGA